jgi:hypothetical protein
MQRRARATHTVNPTQKLTSPAPADATHQRGAGPRVGYWGTVSADALQLAVREPCPSGRPSPQRRARTDGPPVPAQDAVRCQARPLASKLCTPIPRTNHGQTIKKA